jgi:hypothetical protein
MAAQQGHNLGSITAALLRLLDQYGAPSLPQMATQTPPRVATSNSSTLSGV